MCSRIIPARAGFTSHFRPRRSYYRDHPRSRGVYFLVAGENVPSEGSSPLARGLPKRHPPISLAHRIIPARAGFTRRSECCDERRWDHPRSRGVYEFNPSVVFEWKGSSPLARGLPWTTSRSSRPGRIIPARAGFTRVTHCRPPSRRDHPRSRGVYVFGAIGLPRPFGSSPLARGLPLLQDLPNIINGIIPARAGFTLGDRRDSNGGPPYQGAFAFTGDLGTARLSCGSVVAGQRSTTTPSPV